jgi:hypothetical protein
MQKAPVAPPGFLFLPQGGAFFMVGRLSWRPLSCAPSMGIDWEVDRREAVFLIFQSVCGGPSSSLSLAVSIAMRISASVRVRFGLNASSS